MKSMSLPFRLAILLAAAALMCSAPAFARAEPAQSASETAVERSADNDCVANLPFARGAVFCCLDDYLAHLRRQGAIDLPWWREISPGVYEHVVRRTGAERQTATRAELMQRFGFRC
jgi:hypothetical protein